MGGAAEHSGGLLAGLGAKLAGIGLSGMGIKTVIDAGRGLADVLASPIQAASDLSESLNKVGVVFGDSSGAIEAFAAGSAQKLGISKQAALEATGTFGNLFTSLGLGQAPAADLSKNIVTLASDLASFNNIKPEEALEKLKAGLLGESEPLRSVGVNLNEAAVQAEALRLGLAKNKDEIDDAAKVQARYSLILTQTKNAQGDFANTSTGMANAQRIIAASMQDLQTQIGSKLLPVVAPLISSFAQALPRAMELVAPLLDGLGGVVQGLAGTLGTVFAPIMAVLPDLGTAIKQAASFFTSGAGDVEKFRGVLNALLGPTGAQGVMTVFTNISGFFRSTVMPAFQGLADVAKKALGGDLSGALGGLQGIITGIGPKIAESVLGWAKAFVGWVVPMIPGLLAKLGEFEKSVWTWIGTTAAGLVDKFAPMVGAFLDWIGPMIPPLLRELGAFLASMAEWIGGTALPAVISKVGEWGQAFVSWIGPRIGPMLTEVGALLSELGGWLVGTALPAIVAKLGEWGSAFIAWVGPQIPPLLVEAGKLLAQLGGWLVDTALPAIVAKLGEWGGAFLGWIGKDVLPFIGKELEKFGQFVWGWLGDRVKDAKAEAAKLGDAIVRGVWSGIDALGQWLRGKLNDFLSLLPQWAKDLLNIHSPSLVFAEEVGKPIVQGILLGIVQEAPQLQEALRRAIAPPTAVTEAYDVLTKQIKDGLIKGYEEWGKVTDGIFKSLSGDAWGLINLTQDLLNRIAKIDFPSGPGGGGGGGGPIDIGAPVPIGQLGQAARSLALPAARSVARGGDTVINLQVNGSVVTEKDLVNTVWQGLLAKQRRDATLGFQ